MSHIVRDKKKLLARVRRIAGQVQAIERSIDGERDCSDIMLLIATARGAMSSLLAEVVAGHVHHHMIDPHRRPTTAERRAADELTGVVKAYFR
jgi:DNA-binding FrmR family transcriptional regulator